MNTLDPSPRQRWTWVVLVACLGLTLIFLTTSGTLEADLGGDPDEAAHAVTSLMLRDFAAGGWRQPPMTFANTYYADFPKVALGHYPPGYYLLGGVWLLPWVSVQSLFVMQALIAALFGALLFRVAAKFVSLPAALLVGVLIAAMPVTLKQAQFVMSDTLLAVLCLLAAIAWAAYLNRPTAWRALGFGVVATAAILTKGSAMGLCVLPPLTTVLLRRWDLLKKLSWWLSALPVVLFAGPWMLYSTKISAEGMSHPPGWLFIREAVAFYAEVIPLNLGWPLLLLAVVGVGWLLVQAVGRSAKAPMAATLCSLLMGMLTIMVVVPVGLNSRYMLPILPVLLLAAVLVADRVCARLPKFHVLALCVVMGGGFACVAQWPVKEVSGFAAAVQRSGIPQDQTEATRWLIASDPRGEGAVIAAAAFGSPQRSPSPLRVFRGGKELASSDWMGRDYQSPFADANGLLQHLDKLKVSRVFVDLSLPAAKRLPHEQLLHRAMQTATDRWQLDFEQAIIRRPGETGTLQVYTRIQAVKAVD